MLLDNGTTLNVDHVVLTSGHTWNDEPGGESGVHYLRPYPVAYFDQSAPPGPRWRWPAWAWSASTSSPP